MKSIAKYVLRYTATLTVAALAVVAAWHLWIDYTRSPWTRDARVRADVVSIAPDVTGLVDAVAVDDNAVVHKGDLLFTVDRSRFLIARDRATAEVDAAKAALDRASTDLVRAQRLLGTVASERQKDEAQATAAKADSDYRSALSQRASAALDLERAEVRAPHNGIIANLSLHPGDYAITGKAAMALINTDSFRVEGYFEETKMPHIKVGATADIKLLGWPQQLHGRVMSIASGIEDRERSDAAGSLANINPSFTWVRLAQRVPVRISVEDPPEGVTLVAGQTATVTIRH
jgi:RND family efflux transporter MFP subunit